MSALNYAKIQTDPADRLLKILTEISIAQGYSDADAQLEAGKTIGKITRGAYDKRAERLRDWRYSQSISRPLDARSLVRLKRGRDGDFNPVEKRAIGLLKGDRPKPRKNEIEQLRDQAGRRDQSVRVVFSAAGQAGSPSGVESETPGRAIRSDQRSAHNSRFCQYCCPSN